MHECGALATLRDQPYQALRRAIGAGLGGDRRASRPRSSGRSGRTSCSSTTPSGPTSGRSQTVELLVGRILVLAAVRSLDPGAEHACDVLGRAGARTLVVEPLVPVQIHGRWSPSADPACPTPSSSRSFAELRQPAPARGDGGSRPGPRRRRGGRSPRVSTSSPRAHASRSSSWPSPSGRSREAALGRASAPRSRLASRSRAAAGIEVRHQLVADAVREGLDECHAPPAARRASPRSSARDRRRPGTLRRRVAARRRQRQRCGRWRTRATCASAPRCSSSPPRRAFRRPASACGSRRPARSTRSRTGRPWFACLGPSMVGPGPEETAEANALLAHAAYALGDVDSARRYVIRMDARSVAPTSETAARCAIEAATFLVNVDGAVGPAIERLDALEVGSDASESIVEDVAVLRAAIILLATGAGDPDHIRAAADEAFAAGRYRTATDRARVIQYFLGMAVGSDAVARLPARSARAVRGRRPRVDRIEFLADAVVAADATGTIRGRSRNRGPSPGESGACPPAPDGRDLPGPLPCPPRPAGRGRTSARGAAIRRQPRTSSASARRSRAWPKRPLWGGRPRVALERAEAALAVAAPVPMARVHTMLTRAWAHWELGTQPGPTPEVPPSPSLGGASSELEALVLSAAGEHEAAASRFDDAASCLDAPPRASHPGVALGRRRIAPPGGIDRRRDRRPARHARCGGRDRLRAPRSPRSAVPPPCGRPRVAERRGSLSGFGAHDAGARARRARGARPDQRRDRATPRAGATHRCPNPAHPR